MIIFNIIKKNLQKYKTITLGIFFIITTSNTKTVIKIIPAANCVYKNIIFDLGNVCITTSKTSTFFTVFPQICLNPSLFYYLFNNLNIKEQYFELLDEIPSSSEITIYHEGKPLPFIMNDWLNGTYNSNTIKPIIFNAIDESDNPTSIKNLFKAITEYMFTPQSFAQSQVFLEPMINLAMQFKEQGYKIYILSNWDEESFEIIQQKHKVFALFDGIIISGKEKLLKPQSEIYGRLLNKYKLKSKECLFIDDERQNTEEATNLGITSIVHKDFATTCKELMKLGIIKI